MQKIKWLLAGLLLTQSGCKFIEDTGTVETQKLNRLQALKSRVTLGSLKRHCESDDPKNITSSNPGTVTPVLPAIGPDGWREDAGFQINSGATATNSRELLFDFDDYNKLRMKISTNETCEGGNWEDFSSQKNIFSERINQVLTYSVRFLDYEHSETTCFKSQIVHDTEGPSILFAKYPNQTQDPSATSEMTINISDRLTAVKSATCQLIMAQEILESPAHPATTLL
jgi:hypothetical protein